MPLPRSEKKPPPGSTVDQELEDSNRELLDLTLLDETATPKEKALAARVLELEALRSKPPISESFDHTTPSKNTSLRPPPSFPPVPKPIFTNPSPGFINASNTSGFSQRREPKINHVSEFDGDRNKTEQFLIGCLNVFSMQRSTFEDDEMKIGYAISYFKGSAEQWILPFQRRKHLENRYVRILSDWHEFVKAFQQEFGKVHSRDHYFLQWSKCRQKNRPVAEYLSELRSVASELSDYSEMVICDKIRGGLDDYLLDEMSHYDTPGSLNELTQLLHKLEDRNLIRESQRQDRRDSVPKQYGTVRSQQYQSNTTVPHPTATVTPISKSQSSSSTSHPVRKDRNTSKIGGPANTVLGEDGRYHITAEEQERRINRRACTYCDTVGHFRIDCPVRPGGKKRSTEEADKESQKLYLAHVDEFGSESDGVYNESDSEDSVTDGEMNKDLLACSVVPSALTLETTDSIPYSIHTCSFSRPSLVFSRLFVSVVINGKCTKALLDCGATASFMDKNLASSLDLSLVPLARATKLTGFEGKASVQAMSSETDIVSFSMNGHPEELQFYVIESPEHNIILGMDWFHTYNPTLNWKSGKITIDGNVSWAIYHDRKGKPTKDKKKTVRKGHRYSQKLT